MGVQRQSMVEPLKDPQPQRKIEALVDLRSGMETHGAEVGLGIYWGKAVDFCGIFSQHWWFQWRKPWFQWWFFESSSTRWEMVGSSPRQRGLSCPSGDKTIMIGKFAWWVWWNHHDLMLRFPCFASLMVWFIHFKAVLLVVSAFFDMNISRMGWLIPHMTCYPLVI